MRGIRYVFPFLLCLIIAFGSDYLTVREAVSVPTGKTFVYGYNSYADFFYYLSMINEGTRGKFLISSRYTTEQFSPQFAVPFFTTAGFLGSMIGLPPHIIYLGLRIIGGTLLLFLIYLTGKRLFGNYALFALLTVLLSVPLWFVKNGILYQWCDFWTEFDPILRITFLPHHLFANMFGFASLLFTDLGLSKKRLWFVAGGVVSLLLSIVVNPAIALMYAVTLIIALVIAMIRNKTNRYPFFLLLCFLISIGVLYAVSFHIYTSGFPWNVTNIERQLHYPIDFVRFLFVLGPMSVVAFFTVLTVRKWSFLLTALAVWFFLPISILLVFPFISSLIPVVIIRFVESAPYIPTGLLAAYGFVRFFTFLRKKFLCIRAAGISIVVCVFLLAIPTYLVSVKSANVAFDFEHTNDPGFYVTNEAYDVFQWLHIYGTPDEVVLAVEPLSYMIPSFTHLLVPAGNPWSTYNYEMKRRASYDVFTFEVTDAIQTFLTYERISYLVAHLYEKPNVQFLQAFGFEELYKNPGYIIYHRNLGLLPD